MEKKSNRFIYALALFLLLGGVGYLIVSGVTTQAVYFVTVKEALAMEPAELTQARLFGTVAPRNIERAPDSLGVAFDLQEKNEPGEGLRVVYRGAVPDTFKPGVEVIVEGGLNPETMIFTASTLITKCPSKYEKMNEES